jgi:hypothetical protein
VLCCDRFDDRRVGDGWVNILEEAGSGAATGGCGQWFRGYRWLRLPVYVVAFSGTNGLSVAAGPRTMPRVRARASAMSAGRIFYGLPFSRLERSTILGFFRATSSPSSRKLTWYVPNAGSIIRFTSLLPSQYLQASSRALLAYHRSSYAAHGHRVQASATGCRAPAFEAIIARTSRFPLPSNPRSMTSTSSHLIRGLPAVKHW